MVKQEETNLSLTMNAKIFGSGSGSGSGTDEEESIVLSHGYGADQSIWDNIVPCLVDKYKVVLFDWPFSGIVLNKPNSDGYDYEKYSSYDAFADDLIGLVDELNLKSCVVVCHSMSGMIGCIASVKRPDLFSRLVLVGASPRYINEDDYEGGFKISEINDMMANIETNFENWTSAFASLVMGSSDPNPITKFANCLQSMTPEIAVSLAKTVFYSDQRHILEKVVTPCTIVQTTNDIVVPTSVAYYMQDKIKGTSTVEIIDIDGHFPQLTAHEKLVDLIKRVVG